jgi:UDP-glucose 4-epimerase
VRDVVWALTKLIERPESRGQLYNIGNDHEVTINELANMVRSMTMSESPVRRIPYREAYGAGFEDMLRRVPDLSKVRRAVGYRPQYTLEEILQDVIEYTKEELEPARDLKEAC